MKNKKRFCKRGHPRSGKNLMLNRKGYGRCKVCNQKQALDWYYLNLDRVQKRYDENREKIRRYQARYRAEVLGKSVRKLLKKS